MVNPLKFEFQFDRIIYLSFFELYPELFFKEIRCLIVSRLMKVWQDAVKQARATSTAMMIIMKTNEKIVAPNSIIRFVLVGMLL